MYYRIAGNIGGEKTLAFWRFKLKFVNIKSVKLKIRYKTICDHCHVEVEREKRYCLTRTTVLFYLQRSSRKSVQQCYNVEVSGSRGRCPTTTPLLSTATAYRTKSLSPSLLHSLVWTSIHSYRHDGHVYSWSYRKCTHKL